MPTAAIKACRKHTKKDPRQAFTILALLAPNLDCKNGNFHAHHLHPASAFLKRSLATAGVQEDNLPFYEDVSNWNSILNLAHLDANENQSKQDQPLAEWVTQEAERQVVSPAKFCADHLLPDLSYLKFSRFRDFISERRKILGQQLRELL